MRINISKMQSGGALPPFATYTPVTVNNATPAVTTDSDDLKKEKSAKSDKLTDKDLLLMLKDLDALPNDSTALANLLQQFYRLQMIDEDLDPSVLAQKYISTLNQMKIANFNKKEFDKAYKSVTENKGLNEFAINDRGHVAVVEEGSEKPKFVTISEFLNNQDKYYALTNSNLLSMRANNLEFTMNNNILGVVENGIGLEKINSLIHSFITKIGTNEFSTEGYSKKQSDLIVEGLEYLQHAALAGADLSGTTMDGLYKNKILNKEQTQKAQYALNYIYQMLPENAKSLLALKSGSRDGAKQLIATLITSGLDNTIHFETDMIEDAEGKKPGTKTKDESSDIKDNPVLKIQNGIGGDDGKFVLNKGTQAEMSVTGKNYRAMVKPNSGEVIQDTNLSNMLAESGLQNIIDKTSISFGNQIVGQDNVQNIVYRNSGGTRVSLPCVKDAQGIHPDFSILDKYQQVIEKVNNVCDENTPESTRDKMTAQYLREAGLSNLVNADGSIDHSQFQVFFVTDGYTTSKSFEPDSNNDMIEEVKSDDEATYKYVQNILNQNRKQGETKEELDQFSWFNPADWFGLYDKVYKASVYIPIVSNNKNDALNSSSNKIKLDSAYELEKEYQRFQKMLSMNNTSVDVL